MPLHEILERMRRQRIPELNKIGACHLCQSITGRRSYRRFVGHDNMPFDQEDNRYPLQHAPVMRACSCWGDNGRQLQSLRVCEMCIIDNVSTGRVRCCGICGIIACDEYCSIKLIETTDYAWNDSSCLECRGMEFFSEMELFQRRNDSSHPDATTDVPRATRICINCLELRSILKHHFKCSYVNCNNQLVSSEIVELKRLHKPLFPLPNELLDPIIECLGSDDLISFGQTQVSLWKKVESVSKDIVMGIRDKLPPGPLQFDFCECLGELYGVYAEGTSDTAYSLEDGKKTWVSVLHRIEALVRSIYYFDFQIKAGDTGATIRYMGNQGQLVFDRIYTEIYEQDEDGWDFTTIITSCSNVAGITMRGGNVLLTTTTADQTRASVAIFSTQKILDNGVHRVILRYYCLCDETSRHQLTRVNGSIGILRRKNDLVSWAHEFLIEEDEIRCIEKELVFGMEYDANKQKLAVYQQQSNAMRLAETADITNDEGTMVFAAAFREGSTNTLGNQLSIRACDDDEWSCFLSHTVHEQK